MSAIDIAVRRPITSFMFLIAIMLVGVISLTRLSVDLYPDVEFPVIAVITDYDGAGPQEVEKSVTRVIEGAVAGVSGISYIESSSYEGTSAVIVNFDWGADMADMAADIRENLDLVADMLPDEAGRPVTVKFSPSVFPIMTIGLYGIDNLESLYTLADNDIKTKLEQAYGVANVDISGGLKPEIHVEVSKNRLQAYGIDISLIKNLLFIENQNVSGGEVFEGVYQYILRTVGEYETLEDIENIVIQTRGSTPIKLKDVADVKRGNSDETGLVRINGDPGLILLVYKESGFNTVEVADNIDEKIEELNEILPTGIEFQILYDTSSSVRDSINSVINAVTQGGFFAAIILLLFLWNIRTVMIIGVAIPTSIITTFILMYAADVNLNMISLTGLALGVGMMVDSSIVVLENIFFHRRNGVPRVKASIMGAKEVAMPISASTFTTIAVFFPFVFVGGMTSEMFSDLTLTVSISLLASLGISLTVIPMLSSKFLSLKQSKILAPIEIRFTKILEAIDEVYKRILSRAILHKKKVIFFSLTFVIGITTVLMLIIGKESFPEMDEGFMRVGLNFPVGTKIEYTDKMIKEVEKDLKDLLGDNIEGMQTSISGGGGLMSVASDNYGSVSIYLKPKEERDEDLDDLVEKARNILPSYPAEAFVSTSQGGGGFMGGPAVVIEIYGEDFDIADELATKISDIAKSVPGARDVEIQKESELPEIQVKIDRNLSSQAGLNAADISQSIKTGFAGETATTMKNEDDGTDIDVVVRFKEDDRQTQDDIMSLALPSPSGQLIPVGSIATFERAFGPGVVNRKDSSRIVSIDVKNYKRAADKVVNEIKERVAEEIPIMPRGFSIIYAGSYKDMNESFFDLFVAFLLALFIVYAIMASQFESLIAPFIIMFSIPFGLLGSVGLLLITGSTFSIISACGTVVLSGIVINNGIVLVDYMNKLKRRGLKMNDTAIEAGYRRFRPVAMTSLTTILGLFPMALGLGQGSELYQPMAVSILGGLTVSSLFTLVIVPIAYTWVIVLTKSIRVRIKIMRAGRAYGYVKMSKRNK